MRTTRHLLRHLEQDADRMLDVVRHDTKQKSFRHRHQLPNNNNKPSVKSIEADGHRALDTLERMHASALSIEHRYQLRASTHSSSLTTTREEEDPDKACESLASSSSARQVYLQQLYQTHVAGLEKSSLGKSPLGKSPLGKTSELDRLINAALKARSCACLNLDLRVGAAVAVRISSSHRSNTRIYASPNVDSSRHVSAAELAICKATAECGAHSVMVIRGLVMATNDLVDVRLPSGACREFLADFGDFPIYFLRPDQTLVRTSSFALFPTGSAVDLDSDLAQVSTERLSILPGRGRSSTSESESNSTSESNTKSESSTSESSKHRKPKSKRKSKTSRHIRDWTSTQVMTWLRDKVQLGEYADRFAQQQITGATLLCLEDEDLLQLLGIYTKCHRKQICLAIDALKDQEVLAHGLEYHQLEDYLGIVQRDWIQAIVRFKDMFDAMDQDQRGVVSLSQVRTTYPALVVHDNMDKTTWTFPDFASLLLKDHMTSELPSSMICPKMNVQALEDVFHRFRHNPNIETSKNHYEEEPVMTWTEFLQSLDDLKLSFSPSFSLARVPQLSFADFVLYIASIEHPEQVLAFDKALRPHMTTTDSGTVLLILSQSNLEKVLKKCNCVYDQEQLMSWCTTTRMKKKGDEAALTRAQVFLAVQQLHSKKKLKQKLKKKNHDHRHRVIELHESGQIRHCRRHHHHHHATTQKKKKKTRDDVDHSEDSHQSSNNSSEEEEPNVQPMPEILHIKTVFRRFCHDGRPAPKLNILEAVQGLTECGIAAPRRQVLRYFTQRFPTTKQRRAIDVFDFLTAVSAFRASLDESHVLKYATLSHASRRVLAHQDQVRKLTREIQLADNQSKFGSREAYDRYLRRQLKKSSQSSKSKSKLQSKSTRSSEEEEISRQRRSRRREEEEEEKAEEKSSRSARSSSSGSSRSSSRRKARRRSRSSSSRKKQQPRSSSSEEEERHPQVKIKKGSRVIHVKYGKGRVMKAHRETLDIHFDTKHKLKTVARTKVRVCRSSRL